MKLFKKIKKETGSITITVVAAMLFITSMIIIAYFTISNQSSDQGRKAQQITKQYNVTDAQISDKYNQKVNELDGMDYIQIDKIKSLGNLMLSKKTNTETIDSDGNSLTIPGGFKIVEEENKITDKVENGFVIEDKDGNQWVWIPVNNGDLALMHEESSTGWNLKVTSVNTKYRSQDTYLSNQFNSTNPAYIGRINPGQTTLLGSMPYMEPDILPGEELDGNAQNRIEAGFVEQDGETAISIENMAFKLKDDYFNMIESIKKYNGFYVGRYEIGKDSNNNPQVKAGTIMRSISWYKLYKACKSFSNGNVESRMVWSCQWDQICRFINRFGDKKDIEDSSSYGNFSGSTDGNTGSRANCIANNIYDIAGNCWEWNQECFKDNNRSSRGGGYNSDGLERPVTYRVAGSPTGRGGQHSSRPVLYINNYDR